MKNKKIVTLGLATIILMPSLITPTLTYTVYANDLENTTKVISPNDIPISIQILSLTNKKGK
ncbi:hypothetical protein CSW65_14045 [Streptococcus agalactiae]|nr:hypothetical protein CSW65_14045 [Streptococcus agalactiae]